MLDGILKGPPAWVSRVLGHPLVQHIGSLSFGLYLVHNLIPMLLGQTVPWRWDPGYLALRGLAFIVPSWLAAFLLQRTVG